MGGLIEKTKHNHPPIKHRDSVVQRHVFNLAQYDTSQYCKPPQGAGIHRKSMDAKHPTFPIAQSAGLAVQEANTDKFCRGGLHSPEVSNSKTQTNWGR